MIRSEDAHRVRMQVRRLVRAGAGDSLPSASVVRFVRLAGHPTSTDLCAHVDSATTATTLNELPASSASSVALHSPAERLPRAQHSSPGALPLRPRAPPSRSSQICRLRYAQPAELPRAASSRARRSVAAHRRGAVRHGPTTRHRRKRVAVFRRGRPKRHCADCMVIPNASPICDHVRRCWARASRTRSPQRSLTASSTRAINSAAARGPSTRRRC